VRLDQRQQARFPDALCGQLRFQVAQALVRRAAVGRDHGEQGLVALPGVDQLDRRKDDALLVQLGAQGQRARRHATHVGVVRAAGDEKADLVAQENRRDHRHVGEVRPAVVGIVEQDHVARPERPECLDRRGDRGGHAPQVHGDVRGLGHHARLPVKHGAREIQPPAP
jgi:hypothetical protein